MLASVVLAGCGSSGSSDTAKGGTSESIVGTKTFPKDKNSKKYVAFGKEAASAEREAASAVLTRSLEARQAANFVAQCDSLGKAGLESVVGPVKAVGAAKAKCPNSLKSLAEPLSGSKEARADTLSGPIAALRVKGAKGYALYHGNDGNDYAMPMEKEGGKWLVGSILTTELN